MSYGCRNDFSMLNLEMDKKWIGCTEKIPFFYPHSEVYNKSLMALAQRNFSIVEADEKKGFIRASVSSFLKPQVRVQIQIKLEKTVTVLKIITQVKNSWIVREKYHEQMQDRLITTLNSIL